MKSTKIRLNGPDNTELKVVGVLKVKLETGEYPILRTCLF